PGLRVPRHPHACKERPRGGAGHRAPRRHAARGGIRHRLRSARHRRVRERRGRLHPEARRAQAPRHHGGAAQGQEVFFGTGEPARPAGRQARPAGGRREAAAAPGRHPERGRGRLQPADAGRRRGDAPDAHRDARARRAAGRGIERARGQHRGRRGARRVLLRGRRGALRRGDPAGHEGQADAAAHRHQRRRRPRRRRRHLRRRRECRGARGGAVPARRRGAVEQRLRAGARQAAGERHRPRRAPGEEHQPSGARVPDRALTRASGLGLMVMAPVLWSTAGVVTRHVESATAFELVFWRSLFCFLFMGIFLTLLRIKPRLEWPMLASSALWAVMFTAFMIALTLTTTANTLVVMAVAPLLTTLLAALFLRDPLPASTWVATGAAGLGIAWMFGSDLAAHTRNDLLGMLIAFSIPCAAAINVVILRATGASVDLRPALAIGGLLSVLVALPFALPLQASGKDVALLAFL